MMSHFNARNLVSTWLVGFTSQASLWRPTPDREARSEDNRATTERGGMIQHSRRVLFGLARAPGCANAALASHATYFWN